MSICSLKHNNMQESPKLIQKSIHFYFRDDPNKQTRTRKDGRVITDIPVISNRSPLTAGGDLKKFRNRNIKCIVWGPSMHSWFYRIELKWNYHLSLCLFNLWIPCRYYCSTLSKEAVLFFVFVNHNYACLKPFNIPFWEDWHFENIK